MLKFSHKGNNIFILILTILCVNASYFFIGKHFISERFSFSQKTQEVISKTIPGLNLSQQLGFNLVEIRRLQLRGILSDGDENNTQYSELKNSLIEQNEQILSQYIKIVESSEELALLSRLKSSWEKYLDVSRIAAHQLELGNKNEAKDLILNTALEYLITFEKENQDLIEINNRYIISFSEGSSQMRRR